MFIPDPNFFHPGSQIHIKEVKYFNPKKWFLSSQKYDPGFSSRIRILTHPDPDPGVNRIPDPYPQQWFLPELSRPDHKLPQPGDCQKTPVNSKKQ
jgi:hypothetical protein